MSTLLALDSMRLLTFVNFVQKEEKKRSPRSRTLPASARFVRALRPFVRKLPKGPLVSRKKSIYFCATGNRLAIRVACSLRRLRPALPRRARNMHSVISIVPISHGFRRVWWASSILGTKNDRFLILIHAVADVSVNHPPYFLQLLGVGLLIVIQSTILAYHKRNLGTFFLGFAVISGLMERFPVN